MARHCARTYEDGLEPAGTRLDVCSYGLHSYGLYSYGADEDGPEPAGTRLDARVRMWTCDQSVRVDMCVGV